MKIINYQPKTVQEPRPVIEGSGLPDNHFIGCILASKGSGKTNLLLNMMAEYDKTKHFDKVYIFTPTWDSDPKYERLREGSYELKVYKQFSNELLKEVIDEIQDDLRAWEDYKKTKALFEKSQRIKRIEDLSDDDLYDLEKMGWVEPVAPYHREPWSCIIFDDLASDPQLMKQGRSIANALALKCRHLRTSLIYIVQAYKGTVPVMVRKNLDLWVLAANKSLKDKLAVAEELTSYASSEHIADMWDRSTRLPYHYFTINLMAKPNERFRMDFNHAIPEDPKIEKM